MQQQTASTLILWLQGDCILAMAIVQRIEQCDEKSSKNCWCEMITIMLSKQWFQKFAEDCSGIRPCEDVQHARN